RGDPERARLAPRQPLQRLDRLVQRHDGRGGLPSPPTGLGEADVTEPRAHRLVARRGLELVALVPARPDVDPLAAIVGVARSGPGSSGAGGHAAGPSTAKLCPSTLKPKRPQRPESTWSARVYSSSLGSAPRAS